MTTKTSVKKLPVKQVPLQKGDLYISKQTGKILMITLFNNNNIYGICVHKGKESCATLGDEYCVHIALFDKFYGTVSLKSE